MMVVVMMMMVMMTTVATISVLVMVTETVAAVVSTVVTMITTFIFLQISMTLLILMRTNCFRIISRQMRACCCRLSSGSSRTLNSEPHAKVTSRLKMT